MTLETKNKIKEDYKNSSEQWETVISLLSWSLDSGLSYSKTVSEFVGELRDIAEEVDEES